MRKLDLTGQRFGRLVVLEMTGSSLHGKSLCRCVCDCGNKRIVIGSGLRNGRSKSCGCLKIEIIKICKTKHGYTGTPTHISWLGMKQRCYNPNDSNYKYYGRRGIVICDRWLGNNGFENFLEDVGECPKGKSIDRYPNNDGNYEPTNCRWATRKEQSNNQRRKKRFSDNDIRLIRSIKIGGSDLAKILGVKDSAISKIRARKNYADVA